MANYEVTTLEQMQYDILQGDLAGNSLLQASLIPARDKELKTTAKKIIPAINELLKLVNTCKESVEVYSNQIETKVNAVASELEDTLRTEQLESITSKINEMTEELSDTLKQSYASEINERFNTLTETVNDLVEDKVSEATQSSTLSEAQLEMIKQQTITLINETVQTQVESIVNELAQNGEIGGKGEGSEMKKVFLSKVTLKKGEQTIAPFKFTELQDINEQIMAASYSELSEEYIYRTPLFTFTTASLNQGYTTPIDVQINQETEEITLVNKALVPVVLYFFSME